MSLVDSGGWDLTTDSTAHRAALVQYRGNSRKRAIALRPVFILTEWNDGEANDPKVQNRTKHALHGWTITSDPNHALLPLQFVPPPMLPMPKLPNAPPLVDVPDSLEAVALPKALL